ncbi:PDZ domain-containing protein [Bacillus kexueae]|uniref:PDZ domain-containing protein n=1 Tax=Aeribacillus kexueae TaxID=2078952 RepID=UPI001FAFD723|nr:PDZ domain-containing protein [Bacillus kexueae]
MIEQWLVEGIKGIGRYFLHPFVYYFILYSLVISHLKIKRERASFHTRVYDYWDDVRFTYKNGFLAGIILSLITVILGVTLPFGTVLVWTIVTFLFSLLVKPRWLSAAFTIGVTTFLVAVLMKWGAYPSWMDQFLVGINETNFQMLAILIVLLILAEGILVYQTAHKRTTPFLVKSSRGLPIGNHEAKRTWILPLLLLVPGGNFISPSGWWPVLSIHDQTYLILVVPFVLGFQQRVQGSLPEESIRTTGKRIVWLAVACIAPLVVSFWYPLFAFVTVFVALVGRELITVKQRLNDDSAAFFFSKRDEGLMVLGILPNSPAEKMNLQVGETILKVNGFQVKSDSEFYEALQKNRAYCKLEIKDLNGEIRFSQGALYEGSHHELGILFVEDHPKWKESRVPS